MAGASNIKARRKWRGISPVGSKQAQKHLCNSSRVVLNDILLVSTPRDSPFFDDLSTPVRSLRALVVKSSNLITNRQVLVLDSLKKFRTLHQGGS